jgi:hypothetical protein
MSKYYSSVLLLTLSILFSSCGRKDDSPVQKILFFFLLIGFVAFFYGFFFGENPYRNKNKNYTSRNERIRDQSNAFSCAAVVVVVCVVCLILYAIFSLLFKIR